MAWSPAAQPLVVPMQVTRAGRAGVHAQYSDHEGISCPIDNRKFCAWCQSQEERRTIEPTLGRRYRGKQVWIGSPTRARTWDLRINNPAGAFVISLHHQLLTASAHHRHRSRMQCNAGARKTLLAHFWAHPVGTWRHDGAAPRPKGGALSATPARDEFRYGVSGATPCERRFAQPTPQPRQGCEIRRPIALPRGAGASAPFE
jgi:hypothetical protein